nr:MAG TPA: hypothetical protein [Caudoviricetes sp.]
MKFFCKNQDHTCRSKRQEGFRNQGRSSILD